MLRITKRVWLLRFCAIIYCEYDISITDEEYNEAVQLTIDIGLNLSEGPFKHLLGLKRKNRS